MKTLQAVRLKRILLPQFNQRSSSPTLILRRGVEARDMWMVFQQLRNRATQRASAMSVNYAHLAQTPERCCVKKLVNRVSRFVRRLPDHVQLRLAVILSRL